MNCGDPHRCPLVRYSRPPQDDAERAVRAGLELIATVCALKTGVSLQTRVGNRLARIIHRRSARYCSQRDSPPRPEKEKKEKKQKETTQNELPSKSATPSGGVMEPASVAGHRLVSILLSSFRVWECSFIV